MQRTPILFVLFLLLCSIQLAYAQDGTIADNLKTVDVPVEGLFSPTGLAYERLAHATSSEFPSGNLTILASGFCTILEQSISLIPSAAGVTLDGVSCSQFTDPSASVHLSQPITSSLIISFDTDGLQFTDSFTLIFPLPPPITTGIVSGDVDDVVSRYQTSLVVDENADFGVNTTDATNDDNTVINAIREELENNSYLTGAVENVTDRAILIQDSLERIQEGDAAPILELQDTIVFSETYPKILEMNAVIKKLTGAGYDVQGLAAMRDAFKNKLGVLSNLQVQEMRRSLIPEIVTLYNSFKDTADSFNLSTEDEVGKALEERNETIQELNGIKVAAQKVVTAAQIEQDTNEVQDRLSVLNKYGIDTSQIQSLLTTVNSSKEDLLDSQDEDDVRQRILQSDQAMRTIARRYEEQKNLTLRNDITTIIGSARAASLKMERIIKGVREAGLDASVLERIRNSMTAKVNQLDSTYYTDISAAAALIPGIKSDMASFKAEMNRIFEQNPSKFGG